MKQRRISNSPLLDPIVCALVLIAPETHLGVSIDPSIHTIYERAVAAITSAAEIAHVPVFVLSLRSQQQQESMSPQTPSKLPRRQFVLEEHSSPWSDAAFVEALTAADRSILILAGFWLEHEILATALHALADSYDVFVLVDATPARSRLASEPARERLNQAGATPVVTSQMINEWSLEAADAATRTALISILPSLAEVE